MRNVTEIALANSEACARMSLDLRRPTIRADGLYVVNMSTGDTPAALDVAGDFAGALGAPLTLTHLRTSSRKPAPRTPAKERFHA